jgi:hypothetical protein
MFDDILLKPILEVSEMQNSKIEHIVQSQYNNGLLIVIDKGWNLIMESLPDFEGDVVHWTTPFHLIQYGLYFTTEEYVKYGILKEGECFIEDFEGFKKNPLYDKLINKEVVMNRDIEMSIAYAKFKQIINQFPELLSLIK